MAHFDSQTGILDFGAYVPRLRLQRSCIVAAHEWFAPGLRSLGTGERALANWDEDSVTLAVEAARDSLCDFDRSAIGSLTFASTTAPFADRLNAGIVKEALNLSDDIATVDVAGSMRAGTGALLHALQSAPVAHTSHVCVASEKRKALPASEAELINGDAAAAFVVGRGRPLARLIGAQATTVDFVDHFRGSDAAFDYAWEARWVRDEGYLKIAGDALRTALKKFEIPGDRIAHFSAAIPARGVPGLLARAAGIRPEAVNDSLAETLGFAGAAQPLVLLAHTLERARPGEIIAVLSFGQGCEVLLLEVTDEIARPSGRQGVSGWLARRKPEENYLKHLAFGGLLKLHRGMRAEQDQKPSLTALYRNRKAVFALVGGRCRKTGVVQFPRTPIGVAATDAEVGTQDEYPLADRPAVILTLTADHLAYTPDPPSYYGMIEFAGGGRMLAEFSDVDAVAIRVGAPVRMMFRIKAVDEHRRFTKYFWKAVTAAGR